MVQIEFQSNARLRSHAILKIAGLLLALTACDKTAQPLEHLGLEHTLCADRGMGNVIFVCPRDGCSDGHCDRLRAKDEVVDVHGRVLRGGLVIGRDDSAHGKALVPGKDSFRVQFAGTPVQERSLPARLSDSAPQPDKLSFNMETWSQGGLRYFVIGDASAADIDGLAKVFKAAS
jgi:hypothetical protein